MSLKYLLDTNICIYAINGRHPALTERLLSVPPEEIAVSSITLGELEYGAAKSNWSERTRNTVYTFLANYEILPFDNQDAFAFGEIRARLEAAGTMIGILDAMIGAQGVANQLRVVTHNTREFQRIPGVKVEDWTV